MMAHQEKDQAVHEEIKKLEKLQRLAEKVHREAKQVELRLDEIEQRIEEEAKRIDRLHPLDAKHNCDQLERDMQLAEDNIKSMFTDAQTLRDARYQQASEIHKMYETYYINFTKENGEFSDKDNKTNFQFAGFSIYINAG